MKKSLITMIAALALVGVVGAGATLAYLTDATNAVTNTFTVGKVDITLTETSDDGVSNNDNGYDYNNVTPGSTYDKNAKITVDKDSKEAFLFVMITKDAKVTLDINSKLALVDGSDCIYKYADKVNAKDEIQVFTKVTIDKNVEEKDAQGNVTEFENVVVKAFAIQADNITDAEALAAAKKALN